MPEIAESAGKFIRFTATGESAREDLRRIVAQQVAIICAAKDERQVSCTLADGTRVEVTAAAIKADLRENGVEPDPILLEHFKQREAELAAEEN